MRGIVHACGIRNVCKIQVENLKGKPHFVSRSVDENMTMKCIFNQNEKDLWTAFRFAHTFEFVYRIFFLSGPWIVCSITAQSKDICMLYCADGGLVSEVPYRMFQAHLRTQKMEFQGCICLYEVEEEEGVNCVYYRAEDREETRTVVKIAMDRHSHKKPRTS